MRGLLIIILMIVGSCAKEKLTTIVYIDAFKDDTIEQAKAGFLAALNDQNLSEINFIYKNANGDIPSLNQLVRYASSINADLIATCPSLATIAAVQQEKNIPVVMMVSPTPERMKLLDKAGNPPTNLYGVAETIDYIDTSFAMILDLLPKENLSIGLLYNPSEPQSVNAFERLNELADQLGVKLVAKPVTNTGELQLVTGALLNEKIDAFFANPDNTVFGGFETIVNACNKANVPVFTSEAGLVARGAIAAFGPDIYAWGYQSGLIAAELLKGNPVESKVEIVKSRIKVYNKEAAKKYGFVFSNDFKMIF
jgi:putative tryptophan/tyrosine transport system substrate-binding protein